MMPSIAWRIFAQPSPPVRAPASGSLPASSSSVGCGEPGWLGVEVLHHHPRPPFHRRTAIPGSSFQVQGSFCLLKFECAWSISAGAEAIWISAAAAVDRQISRIHCHPLKEALALAPRLTQVQMPQVVTSKRWSVTEPWRAFRTWRCLESRLLSLCQRPRRKMVPRSPLARTVLDLLSASAPPRPYDLLHCPTSSGRLVHCRRNYAVSAVRENESIQKSLPRWPQAHCHRKAVVGRRMRLVVGSRSPLAGMTQALGRVSGLCGSHWLMRGVSSPQARVQESSCPRWIQRSRGVVVEADWWLLAGRGCVTSTLKPQRQGGEEQRRQTEVPSLALVPGF